ncbi:acyl-CoA thioesterase [Paenibacillus albiflavus]|uniref:acyl-CoA thioesterase n=1 Tax=Paenibacillus albiflavus TaxID=2545760 RepID=UPI0014049EA7|nr:thioesterase family protein [Paenibacillus albiflavus]
MLESEYVYRTKPRFIDIDAYGIMHHSKYFSLLEEARFGYITDVLKFELEDFMTKGVLFPVLNVSGKYYKSITYGDEISIHMKVQFHEEGKITFNYILYNQYEEKLFVSQVIVGYIEERTRRLLLTPPAWLFDRIKEVFLTME